MTIKEYLDSIEVKYTEFYDGGIAVDLALLSKDQIKELNKVVR